MYRIALCFYLYIQKLNYEKNYVLLHSLNYAKTLLQNFFVFVFDSKLRVWLAHIDKLHVSHFISYSIMQVNYVMELPSAECST